MTTEQNEEQVDPEKATKIRESLALFPLPRVVARYSHDYDLPEDMALRVVEEMKRFLALCAMNSSARYGMRGIVDDAWHTFMIFSRDYFAFCEAIAGTYIHHEPEERGSDDGLEQRLALSRDSYRRTLADYEKVFGSEPPIDIWPRVQSGEALHEPACRNACGRSCSRCGRGCASCGHGCSRCNRCGRG
ncbi:hypothetical protein WME89_12090 [Sorangium sp. So ce321]|uniref:glycine-rich domain-containing protein n=1 Tax=Sorangium sp. So ce321 TaxID=3133300 RepID=UPI003F5FE7C5